MARDQPPSDDSPPPRPSLDESARTGRPPPQGYSQNAPAPLFCPHCDSNLTGLTNDRCPECGREFDAHLLRQLEPVQSRPITLAQLVKRLLILPALLWLSLLATFVERDLDWLALTATCAYALLLGGAVMAASLAERLAVTRALSDGLFRSGRHDRWFIFLCFVGLYLAQLALALGAALATILLAKWLGLADFARY